MMNIVSTLLPRSLLNVPLDRWANRGFKLVSMLLVIGIAYSLASLTWFLYSPGDMNSKRSSAKVENLAKKGNSTSTAQIDVTKLKAMNLFGKVGAVAPKPKVVKQTNVPETTLKLELEGVFRSDTDSGSTAIIAEQGKPGKLYRVGDMLPGKAVLEQVDEDKVLLKRNGKLETLKFPELQGITAVNSDKGSSRRSRSERGSVNTSGANRRTTNRRAYQQRRTETGNAKSRVGRMLESGARLQPERLLKTFSEDFQENPQNALDDLGVEVVPVSKGGGYVISNNIPANLLRSSGLRYGDIIRSVNGQQLGNVNADQALYRELLSKNEVTVEVERGARRFTVTVPVPK